ncbi:MAG: histidine phosphatase family protein [Dehalococcoidia bacterium]|jgi:probable phosphoglycerate mutase|nr:histidine phosphatase family protein [Dehalococcoidia bacterium]MDP7470600.1 histidine phosphatase family protein [Dehalococcoidia bacterium]
MRLILVRHGQTQWNVERRFQGSSSDIELNEQGRRQAWAAGEAMKAEKIDAIYSSPLSRARDTAQQIAQHHDLQVTLETDFTEIDGGDLEGSPFGQLPEEHPAFWKQWREGTGSISCPGGESLDDVMERAWAALRRIRDRHHGDTVVVVCHTFTVIALFLRALDLAPGLFRRLRLEVGSFTEIDLNGDQARLVKFNDTCHWKEV